MTPLDWLLVVMAAGLAIVAYFAGRADEEHRWSTKPAAVVRLYWDGAVIEGAGPLKVERMARPAPRPDDRRLPGGVETTLEPGGPLGNTTITTHAETITTGTVVNGTWFNSGTAGTR